MMVTNYWNEPHPCLCIQLHCTVLYFHETLYCVKYLFTKTNDQKRGFLLNPLVMGLLEIAINCLNIMQHKDVRKH